MTPKLIVEQKITAFVNRYEIYETTANGEKMSLLALAEQKRLAFKEKVTFFADLEKTIPAFTFRSEKVLDVHGKYIVEDANGNILGSFKKDFKKSLLNSTWTIVDANDQTQFALSENNKTLAIFRRFVGFIPVIGDIADVLMVLFRYHFVFKDPTGANAGMYTKTKLFKDHYVLSEQDQALQNTDIRVLAAVAVALDALQSR